jgi:hypothetical protein
MSTNAILQRLILWIWEAARHRDRECSLKSTFTCNNTYITVLFFINHADVHVLLQQYSTDIWLPGFFFIFRNKMLVYLHIFHFTLFVWRGIHSNNNKDSHQTETISDGKQHMVETAHPPYNNAVSQIDKMHFRLHCVCSDTARSVLSYPHCYFYNFPYVSTRALEQKCRGRGEQPRAPSLYAWFRQAALVEWSRAESKIYMLKSGEGK